MPFSTTQVAGFGEVPSIEQERLADCAPSCVGLVLRMTGYQDADSITPQDLRSASQRAGGRSYRPAVGDVVQRNRGGGALAGQGMGDAMRAAIQAGAGARFVQRLDDAGTYSDNIASMLKDGYGFGSANGSVSADIKGLLRGASFANPYIVNVVWEGGGAHWVVCCGFKRNRFSRSVFCFSDPYYGAFSLAIPTDRSGGSVQPSYVVPSTHRGGSRGHLSGWVINVV